MLKPISISIAKEKILSICNDQYVTSIINSGDDNKIKTELNEPSGDFFYDFWKIKDNFRGTVFEDILDSLPKPIGEARLIVLKPGTCYHSHADIDDRYHLNLQGQYSYLIDLENQQMFPTEVDGEWYEMNAGCRHTAANFGSIPRIQLVVRKLLPKNVLVNPVRVQMNYIGNRKEKFRFVFDDRVSPWLNYACKKSLIDNFKTDQKQIWFDIESSILEEIQNKFADDFSIVTA